MSDGTTGHHPNVVRNGRGLSIAGTRITLYDVMDYVTMGKSPKYIRDILRLTDEQVRDALAYIAAHRTEVEQEYQEVLRRAEEDRRYWEDRNKERFAQIAVMPRKPEFAAIHAKIDAARAARRERDNNSR